MPTSAQSRLRAIDWMRGLVIVLMTIDHASGAFNAGRLMTDATWMWKPGSALPVAQFMLRWLTHLCAPTFVFLAGTSIALSTARRRVRGDSERSIDSALLQRGAFIALLDPLWMSLGFLGWQALLLQVMYALGVSMMAMAALRRLPPRVLTLVALAMFVLGDAISALGMQLSGGHRPTLPVALSLSGGLFDLPISAPAKLIVAYPVLPWLAMMMLGHALGSQLATPEGTRGIVRKLLLWGVSALVVFGVVRAANGYGNAMLLREGDSLVQWLHVSKYPPSLTYSTLELGLMALLLAGFFWIAQRGAAHGVLLRVLGLLGQTSLFFYVLHAHLLEGASLLLGMHSKAGIAVTLLASALVIALLLPACARYLRYKHENPQSWAARFV